MPQLLRIATTHVNSANNNFFGNHLLTPWSHYRCIHMCCLASCRWPSRICQLWGQSSYHMVIQWCKEAPSKSYESRSEFISGMPLLSDTRTYIKHIPSHSKVIVYFWQTIDGTTIKADGWYHLWSSVRHQVRHSILSIRLRHKGFQDLNLCYRQSWALK